jgi:hypothetical protein
VKIRDLFTWIVVITTTIVVTTLMVWLLSLTTPGNPLLTNKENPGHLPGSKPKPKLR